MTGEMSSITKDGIDSNGDTWELHAAITKALRGTLRPFDVYRGPYITVKRGTRCHRLWIYSKDGVFAKLYDDRSGLESEEFPLWDRTPDGAIAAARSLLHRRK